jgi:hypothetical protein
LRGKRMEDRAKEQAKACGERESGKMEGERGR